MTTKTLEPNHKNRQDLNSKEPLSSQPVFPTLNTEFPLNQISSNKDILFCLRRRRAIARMIRVELEITLSLINQALQHHI